MTPHFTKAISVFFGRGIGDGAMGLVSRYGGSRTHPNKRQLFAISDPSKQTLELIGLSVWNSYLAHRISLHLARLLVKRSLEAMKCCDDSPRPNPPLNSDPACIALRSLSTSCFLGSAQRLGAGGAG